MNFWILFWLIISIALIGFLGWTVLMIARQKKAWKAFAEKHGLSFKANALMQGPEISGKMQDYKISYFTSEHVTPDMRGTRKLTAIEIRLNSQPPFEGAVASGGMVNFINNVGFDQELIPEYEEWNRSYLAAADDKYKLKALLGSERLKVLTQLMKFPHGWVCYVFRNEVALLRIDTPQSMDKPEQLEKISKAMIKAATVLELKDGERAQIDKKAEDLEAAEKKQDIRSSEEKAAKLELE